MYLRTKPPSRLTLSRSVLTSGPETRLLGSLDPFSPTSNGLTVTRHTPRPSLDRAEKLTRSDPCKPTLLKFFVRKGEHLFDFFSFLEGQEYGMAL